MQLSNRTETQLSEPSMSADFPSGEEISHLMRFCTLQAMLTYQIHFPSRFLLFSKAKNPVNHVQNGVSKGLCILRLAECRSLLTKMLSQYFS